MTRGAKPRPSGCSSRRRDGRAGRRPPRRSAPPALSRGSHLKENSVDTRVRGGPELGEPEADDLHEGGGLLEVRRGFVELRAEDRDSVR